MKHGQILIYETEDGATKEHINTIFLDKEVIKDSLVTYYLTTANDDAELRRKKQ